MRLLIFLLLLSNVIYAQDNEFKGAVLRTKGDSLYIVNSDNSVSPLMKWSTWLQQKQDIYSRMNNTFTSPTLIGNPIAPTASSSTNNNQIATTAFVQNLVNNRVLTTDFNTFQSLNTVNLANKEPLITTGSNNQYWRGDKTWVIIDKSTVGLGNIDNTSDANKPISSLVQTALNNKQNTLSFDTSPTNGSVNPVTSGGLFSYLNTFSSGFNSSLTNKEDITNKSTATSLGTSNTLYPTQNAVKVYADTKVPSTRTLTINGTSLDLSINRIFTTNVYSTDIIITDQTKGVIFKKPDGTGCYRMTIDNAGTPVFTSITCPN